MERRSTRHSKRHAAETLDADEEVVSEDGPRPSPVDEVDEQQHEDGPRPSPIDEVDGQHEDGPRPSPVDEVDEQLEDGGGEDGESELPEPEQQKRKPDECPICYMDMAYNRQIGYSDGHGIYYMKACKFASFRLVLEMPILPMCLDSHSNLMPTRQCS